MKDMIKQVALSVAHSMQKALPMEMQYGVNAEFTVEFATAFLAALSERAEAVAIADGSFNHNCELGSPLFTFPPIHDIEAIENRVAEACAKLCHEIDITNFQRDNLRDTHAQGTYDCEAAIRLERWRKHK